MFFSISFSSLRSLNTICSLLIFSHPLITFWSIECTFTNASNHHNSVPLWENAGNPTRSRWILQRKTSGDQVQAITEKTIKIPRYEGEEQKMRKLIWRASGADKLAKRLEYEEPLISGRIRKWFGARSILKGCPIDVRADSHKCF